MKKRRRFRGGKAYVNAIRRSASIRAWRSRKRMVLVREPLMVRVERWCQQPDEIVFASRGGAIVSL